MYALNGLNQNLENILILASLEGSIPQNAKDLKSKYRHYLSSVQPAWTVSEEEVPELIFEHSKTRDLMDLFGQRSTLNDLNQERVIDSTINQNQTEVLAKTRLALVKLNELDPTLSALFNLVVEKIFFAGSTAAGGGSSSGALGTIWINPRSSWTEQDYLEFLVHELTHQLVFLDERCRLHYENHEALELRDNFAYSAILKRSRPLDKVVHSLFVVFEVLKFRLHHFDAQTRTFLHPDTESLFLGAFETLTSIEKIKPGLISTHLASQIHELERKLTEMRKGNLYESQFHL